VQLAAARALADLRALVLGDHPLKLAQQLILGRAGALAAAREDDLDARAGELLEPQHLVGVAAREPVRGVAEQHLERSLGGVVAQPLQRRPDRRRAGEPLVTEHQLLGDEQAALDGELTQPGELTLNRPLLALALGGHPWACRGGAAVRAPRTHETSALSPVSQPPRWRRSIADSGRCDEPRS